MSINNIEILRQPKKEKIFRQEIKEFLERKIEGKIKIIQELWQLVEDNKGLSAEDFKNKIMEFHKNFMDCFEIDIKDRYERFKECNIEITEIKRMIKDEKYSEDEIDELFNRMETLEEEINEISNEDLLFLKRIDDFVQNIILKKNKTDLLKKVYKEEGKDKLFKNLEFDVFYDLSEEEKDKIDISFSGYSINFILPKDIYEKVSNNFSRGSHYSGTVINLILDRPKKESTIKHEENHNLSESFVGSVVYSDKFLDKVKFMVDKIDKMMQWDIPEFLITNNVFFIEQAIADYFLSNFSELIADIDRPSRENIRSYFLYFSETINDLNAFISEIDNKKLRNKLSLSIDKLEKNFIDHINKLADIYFVSDNTENNEEMKGALLLFGYDKLDKVERYLKTKVGKEKYNVLKSIRLVSEEKETYFSGIKSLKTPEEKLLDNILGGHSKRSEKIIETLSKNRESFFRVENLKKLISELRALKDINQKDFEQIISLISPRAILDNESASLIVRKIDNVDELIEMDRLFKKLGKLVGIPELSNQIEKHYLQEYASDVFSKSLASDNFEKLSELFKNDYFDMSGAKEDFKNDLSEEISFMMDDLPDYCNEDIKKTKFWKFIKELGLEDDALQILDNISNNRSDES